MKLTLIQANPVVGDIQGNTQRLIRWLEEYGTHSDLLVLPELYLTGYPPKDLLLREDMLEAVDQAIDDLLQASSRYPAGILFGAPRRRKRLQGHGLTNTALLLAEGRIVQEQDKVLLPNYDVFDEQRYFDAGETRPPVAFCGLNLGICVCEDAWLTPGVRTDRLYSKDPVADLATAGAEIIINLSASPFRRRKESMLHHIGAQHARNHRLAFVLVNQVGGNDELIFDGRSFAINHKGHFVADLAGFEEDVTTLELNAGEEEKARLDEGQPQTPFHSHSETDNVRLALVLGIRDYFDKVGAKTALIGLSGGIDSSVVACIAAEALGPKYVYGVTLPGPYSSEGSQTDSQQLAEQLGIHFDKIPITPVFEQMLDSLAPHFKDKATDLTEENMQARIRGDLLMALANKFGHLVLSTSNKSEIAVGYATLYGDTIGALAVIGDLLKGQVYELAEIYSAEAVIPEAILAKAPSAELRPDQKDSDSLPPYEILDVIVRLYVENALSACAITETGYDKGLVEAVLRLIDQSEYKRRQLPPVLRVTHKSFGISRRLPVAARYSGWPSKT